MPENKDIVQIDTVHNRIHDGLMYQADFVDLALANNGELEMLVRVPADKGAHLHFGVTLGGDGQAKIFSGPTLTGDGAAVTPVNRNTFSSNAADVLAFSAPIVAADGTIMSDTPVPGGSGGNSVGSSAGTFMEWILAPGDYLFKLTNKSGGAAVAGIALDWYEPDDL